MNNLIESIPLFPLGFILLAGLLMVLDSIFWLGSKMYEKEYRKIDADIPKIISLTLWYPCMLITLYAAYSAFEYYIGFKWVETYGMLLFLSVIIYAIREK